MIQDVRNRGKFSWGEPQVSQGNRGTEGQEGVIQDGVETAIARVPLQPESKERIGDFVGKGVQIFGSS